MAGDTKKKRVATAIANLCISCAGFESCIRRLERGSKKKGSARDMAADLPDDVLVDILSRLPIKSLCRCNLVSTRWQNLISHPEHRKKLPQTLAGFFCDTYFTNPLPNLDSKKNPLPKRVWHFTTVSRAASFIDTSLSFLPRYKRIDIKDTCNGLLLCHCWKPTHPVTMDSVVCNPATAKWVIVPDSGWSSQVSRQGEVTRLGFDPAVTSHFHVFEFIQDSIWYTDVNPVGWIEVVAVYSSKTGVWTLNELGLDPDPSIYPFAIDSESKSVFFNGVLHLTTVYGTVLAINLEGKILRSIPVPTPISVVCKDYPVNLYLSQGHLYLAMHMFEEEPHDYQLSVWVLEDYTSENWTLKHNVDLLHLFGADYYSKFGGHFIVISIHPEHDMIFMVSEGNNMLMSYDMDHMRLRYISQFRGYRSVHYTPYPYVPLFSESLADDDQ